MIEDLGHTKNEENPANPDVKTDDVKTEDVKTEDVKTDDKKVDPAVEAGLIPKSLDSDTTTPPFLDNLLPNPKDTITKEAEDTSYALKLDDLFESTQIETPDNQIVKKFIVDIAGNKVGATAEELENNPALNMLREINVNLKKEGKEPMTVDQSKKVLNSLMSTSYNLDVEQSTIHHTKLKQVAEALGGEEQAVSKIVNMYNKAIAFAPELVKALNVNEWITADGKLALTDLNLFKALSSFMGNPMIAAGAIPRKIENAADVQKQLDELGPLDEGDNYKTFVKLREKLASMTQ